MSDLDKLQPQRLLGKDAVEAASTALIFGYQLRTVKINGNKAISDQKLKEDGFNEKRWDVGITNGIVSEIWVHGIQPETAKKK